MKKLSLLLCLVSVAITQAVVVDPRGARPVEPSTRDEKCATQREWPFCSDDDWYSKCPSGCRIQGLLDRNDHELLKKIAKIRSLLDQHKARHRSVDLVSKQTYDILREKLTLDTGNDNMYYNLAQTLRQRITEMKVRIERQQQALAALKSRVKDQVAEIQKLEVDIDIKLRSCKGSCGGHTVYQVDQDSYVVLDKQMNQLDAQAAQSVDTVRTLYVMKSRPLQDVIVDSRFKSKDVAAQRTEDVFPQVNTVQFILEEEGSSSSPATVSKVPGTSHSTSSSSPSSSSSSSGSPSKSITELSGRGDGGFDGTGLAGQPSTRVTTKTVSCTKTIRRTVVHTKDGPVERVEEVGGGPECDGMDGLSKGSLGSLFPTFGSSSSSFSSFQSGGSKGSILADSKSGLNPFGADFGAFMTDNAEDDLPDFHARSVKSTVVERQADFVGTVCQRFKQQKQDGRHSASGTNMYRMQRCSTGSHLSLCSDDDWASRCPSGCRLQGLMSQMESDMEKKLQMFCQKSSIYEIAMEKSMTEMTHIYNSNRRVMVNRYISELKFVESADKRTKNLGELRQRSRFLAQKVKELSGHVRKQVEELHRTEVDVDMKLRTCQGTCRAALPFSVDHHDYQALQTDLQRTKPATPPQNIPRVTLRPANVGPPPSAEYRKIPTVQKELLTQFEDIEQNRFVLLDQADEVKPLRAAGSNPDPTAEGELL